MDEPETIEPEYLDIKKEYEIKIEDNKIRIEMNKDEIIFSLFIDLSFNKYIKIFKYDEFIKIYEISKDKDINKIYNTLIKYKYEINEKEKKIIFNNGKVIKLEESIKLTNEEMFKELIIEIKTIKKEKKDLETQVYELENKVYNYKDEINLIYHTDNEGEYRIFGNTFVENNINNIELNINENKSKLVSKCKLKKGDNNIKIIIKNKIKDLRYMFDSCCNLKNIEELKYLNVKYCTNFNYMFLNCSSLNDITPLKNWNVTNGTNFNRMFAYCSSLKDITPLKNWNVSNGIHFIWMFHNCRSLNDIIPLKNWNLDENTFNNIFK